MKKILALAALVAAPLMVNGQITEEWLVTPAAQNGNTWLGSDSGRGITWVSASAAGNPNAFDVVVVKSSLGPADTEGAAGALTQVLNADTGAFVSSGALNSTGDTILGTYRLDAFDDGVLVTNGFEGTIRVADDVNATNPRNLNLTGGASSGFSRAMDVSGDISANTGLIAVSRGSLVDIFEQDTPSTPSFTHAQQIDHVAAAGATSEDIDGIGMSSDASVLVVSNSNNAGSDGIAIYRRSGGTYTFDRLFGQYGGFVRQGVDTNGTYIAMSEGGGSQDGFGIGLIGATSVDDTNEALTTPANDDDSDGIYDAGTTDLNSANLTPDITFGANNDAYGYSQAGGVFKLSAPTSSNVTGWQQY